MEPGPADTMLTIAARITPRDLAFSDMTHDDLFTLITGIDDAVAEYDFTERLRDHFAEVLAKEDAAAAKSPVSPQGGA